MNKIEKILKEELKKIKLSKKELSKIKKIVKKFSVTLKSKLKNKKIKAEVFIGGSLAKDTLLKKENGKYDIDIFVRFDKKYSSYNISSILEKILGKKAKKIHGSRDYFQIKKNNIIFEIIPVLKIKNVKEAKNITDLSYFHVKYVSDKIKKEKNLKNEIILTKKFIQAQNLYGAESYIKGFSGYSIELLVCHYKSFLNIVKNFAKYKNGEFIIIDDANHYKNKEEVFREINESKIRSPLIIIDPTYNKRNVTAGLSEESFEKFVKICKEFLENPSNEFFKRKNIKEEFEKIKNSRIISIKTNKQKGDIAGTKSKKFYNFFLRELKKEFDVIKSDFEYDEEKNLAFLYLVIEKKEDEIKKGPKISLVEHFKKFKEIHKNIFIKNGYAFIKIEHNLSFEEFIESFKRKYKKIITEMGIKEIKIEK